jgi:hypothetical protein
VRHTRHKRWSAVGMALSLLTSVNGPLLVLEELAAEARRVR